MADGSTARAGSPVSIGFVFDTHLVFWGPKPPRPPISSTTATQDELNETVFSATLPRGLTAQFSRLGIASITATSGFPVHAKLGDAAPSNSDLQAAMSERSRQVHLLNAFALCIHSVITAGPFGFIDATAVTGDSAGILKFDDRGYLDSISGRLRLAVRDRQGVRVAYMGGYPNEALAASVELFREALAVEPDIVPLLSLLNEAAAALRLHNFASATIFAWSVCERTQGIMWRRYYTAALGPNGPSKERRKILDGRDYSASVVISVLELAGIYDAAFARDLNRSRKKRNDWIHSGDEPAQADAEQAVDCALKAIYLAFELNITVSRSSAFHY